MFTRRITTVDAFHLDCRNTGESKWWDTSSFYSFLKAGLKVPFSIDQDVVIYDIPTEEYKRIHQPERINNLPSWVVVAADFLGLLDDIETLTVENIKSSYRALPKIHHPDLGGSSEQFIELTKHVDTLLKYYQAA